jgi:cytoskeletal protein CcmA (bactofilin family)
VEGDIVCQTLAIEQGAYFEGKSRRSDNPLAEMKASGFGSGNAGSNSANSPSVASPIAAE